MIHFLIIFAIISTSICSQEHITLRSKSHGMFSMFHFVLLFLQQYEKKQISGFDVEFERTGIYYDEKLGLNWWEYYFEPIKLGDKNEADNLTLIDVDTQADPWIIEFCNSVHENHRLLRKYIKIKDVINDKINKFYDENFKDYFIIGVHYRGTDKLLHEASRVEHQKVISEINKITSNLSKRRKYKIFLATDETQFIEFMEANFGDKICYCAIKRSSDGLPIHYDLTRNPYQLGEEALIDALLLSRTNVLIRTSSNLSLCSRYFNPHLTVIELSQRNMSTACQDYFH